MRWTIAACLSALLLAALPAGCGQLKNTARTVSEWTQLTARSMITPKLEEEPIFLDVAGPLAMDIDSFNGNVTLVADDTLEHAQITVTRRAVHGYGRREEAEASLEQMSYTLDIVAGELGQVLRIRTGSTNIEPHFQRIDLLIEAPEIDGVKVRTRNGHVVAEDVQGAIDIMTYDGDVRVMTNFPMHQPVEIINHAGSIDYRVRAESAGDINCQTVRGKVIHLATHGDWTVYPGTDHDTLLASFNGGTNPVILRAADGDIRIAVVPNPTQVGTFIVD